MNIWIAIAFVVCAAGLVIGGPFQMGELGKMIFLLGFGLGIVGVLIGTFRMSLSKSPTRAIRGIRVGAVGFAIFSVGLMLDFFDLTPSVSDAIVAIGVVVTIVGIGLGALAVAKNRDSLGE